MTKDTGGPAFPCTVIEGAYHRIDHTGLTLRDHFAGLAMQAAFTFMLNGSGHAHIDKGEAVASAAYEVADAMLQERNKP